MKNNFKRILAMLLAVMMVVGMCAFPVSAATPSVEQPDPCDEHTWVDKGTVAPTCTTQGYDLFYCTTCYRYEQRNVTPKGDHDMKALAEKKATCKTDGYPAGQVCTVCHWYAGKGTAAYAEYDAQLCGAACQTASGHTMGDDCRHVWGDPVADGNPCLDGTEIKYTCTEPGCNETQTENGNGHVWAYDDSTLVPPTCHLATTEEPNRGLGSIRRYCTVSTCDVEHTVVINRIAHVLDDSDEGATATNCGKACVNCDYSEATGGAHDWRDGDPVVDPAKCGVKGSETSVCELCGYEKVDEIPALKHGVSDKTTPGDKAWGKDNLVREQGAVHTTTETTDGGKWWKCAGCNEEWFEMLVDVEHSIYSVSEQIDSTCQLPGMKMGRCTCGLMTTEDIEIKACVPAATQPTGYPKYDNYNCVTGGYIVYWCAGQGAGATAHEYKYYPPANQRHNYQPYHVDEECGKDGFDGTKCTLCGDKQGDVIPMPSNHVKEKLVQFGYGCTTDLYVYYHCTNAGCDYNYTGATTDQAVVDAFYDQFEDKADWYEFTAKDGKHATGTEEVVEASTCKTDGWYGIKCSKCKEYWKTRHIGTFDPYNHEGDQTLTHFRWVCDTDIGEGLYSTNWCEACEKHYNVISKIELPDTGDFTLTVGANDLEFITIYVDGVAIPVTTLTIPRDIITEEGLVSGSAHIFARVNVSTDPAAPAYADQCQLCGKIEAICSNFNSHELDPSTKTPATNTSTCTQATKWTGKCKYCGANMEDYYPLASHEYSEEIVDAKYLASAATCTSAATYYKSCTCGASSKGQTGEATFADGNPTVHKYDKSKVDPAYLVPGVTVDCMHKAKYYKSCACGASSAGTEFEAKFEGGNFGSHDYDWIDVTTYDSKKCVTYQYAKYYYCDICETVSDWDGFIPQVAHQKGDDVYVDPTCVMLGYTYYKCEFCEEATDAAGEWLFPVEIDTATPNAPHINNHDEKLTGNCMYIPTDYSDYCSLCDKDVDEYHCKVCHDDITPKHSLGAADDCGIKTCTVCGKKDDSNADHDYVTDEDASYPATKDETGLLVQVCSRCGKEKSTTIGKLAAVVYSLDVYNPNGSYIVNGGKAYVAINIKCNDINVSAVAIKLDVDQTVFEFVGVVEGGNALGGQTFATWDETNGNVTATAFAGNERESVPMNGDFVLCVLEFNVVYAGGSSVNRVDNNVKESDITFINDSFNDVLDEKNKPAEFDITTNASVKAEINQIGDIDNNGQIALEDVKAVLDAVNKYLANGQQFTEDFEYDSRYDINKDGKYSTADFNYLVQAFIGKMTYTEIVEIQE